MALDETLLAAPRIRETETYAIMGPVKERRATAAPSTITRRQRRSVEARQFIACDEAQFLALPRDFGEIAVIKEDRELNPRL